MRKAAHVAQPFFRGHEFEQPFLGEELLLDRDDLVHILPVEGHVVERGACQGALGFEQRQSLERLAEPIEILGREVQGDLLGGREPPNHVLDQCLEVLLGGEVEPEHRGES